MRTAAARGARRLAAIPRASSRPHPPPRAGADTVVFGYLKTLFSILQLLGSPLIGRVCDRYGGRAAMLVSQAGGFLGYSLLAMSSNVTILFISQTPMALMHAMHAGQALISDFSDDQHRVRARRAPQPMAACPAVVKPSDAQFAQFAPQPAALGRLSLSYGTGMVVGSLAGGYLSSVIGNANVAFIGAAAAGLSLPIDLLLLPAGRPADVSRPRLRRNAPASFWKPATLPHARPRPAPQVDVGKESPVEDKDSTENALSFGAVGRLLHKPQVRQLLLINLVMGMAGSLYQSSFSMVGPDQFGLQPEHMGLMMSYAAAITVLVNTFVVGWVAARFSERTAVLAAISTLVLCFIAYTGAHSMAHLFAIAVPMSASSAVLYTVLASTFTTVVSAADRGASLGLSHAVRPFCGVVSPTLVGVLYTTFGFQSLGALSATLMTVALYFAIVRPSRPPAAVPPPG